MSLVICDNVLRYKGGWGGHGLTIIHVYDVKGSIQLFDRVISLSCPALKTENDLK